MRWIVLSVVWAGLVGASMIWKSRWDLISSGYCVKEKRYLTDEEIVDAAVAGFIELLDKTPSIIDNNDRKKTLVDESGPVKLSFSSVEDFYNQNPYCCYRVVQGEKRHIRTDAVVYDIYGQPMYDPHIYLTVSGAVYKANSGRVTACGEFIPIFELQHYPENTPLRFYRSSSSKLEENWKRPDRRKKQQND